MPITELMLAANPGDAAVRGALGSFFDVPAGAVQELGAMIGASEGAYPMTVIIDTREVSGDVALALTVSSKIKVDPAAIALHLAAALDVGVLYEAGPQAHALADPGGDARPVRVEDGEDTRVVRLVEA